MITQLDTENADRNLTSQVTVLTHTPDASNPMLCQGLILFGDGSKDLDGSGGDFELTVTVGGQTIEPDPQTITFSTAGRTAVWTTVFPVPANSEVVLKAKSPNGADTDVDVTAYLYDVSAKAEASSVGTLVGSVGTQAGSVGTQVGSVGTLVSTCDSAVDSVGTLVGSVGTQAGSVGTQATSVGTLVSSVGNNVYPLVRRDWTYDPDADTITMKDEENNDITWDYSTPNERNVS